MLMAGTEMRFVRLMLLLLYVAFLHNDVVEGDQDVSVERAGSSFLEESVHGVTLGNDRIQITLGKGQGKGVPGSIRSLKYRFDHGKQPVELLQTSFTKISDKYPGYWDMHWIDMYSAAGTRRPRNRNSKCSFGQSSRTSSDVPVEQAERPSGEKGSESDKDNQEMLGVTYQAQTNSGSRTTPVDMMVNYAVRKGVTGVYSTLMVDHTETDPAMLLTELRLVLMLNPSLFDYTYVADDRQRYMPTRTDISRHSSSKLAFKEARLITESENASRVGEVDHKYIHSIETKDSSLYGWISTELGVGVWIIAPNKWEYLGGGPTKQELSVQTGPKLLAMLHSQHYGTPAINLDDGEEWSKVFGPFLIYVNQGPSIDAMIADAKSRAVEEARLWPYGWVPFTDYRGHEGRGTVVGKLVRQPGTYNFTNTNSTSTFPEGSWIGLVDHSSVTSNFEDEVKSYQFWNTTNEEGEFTIYNVNPGKYVLQCIVHGFLVDTSVLHVVTVEEEWVSNVGDVFVAPVQKGPIVWEIGYPDRSAAEFLIPADLSVGTSTTGSSSGKNVFRQYGLWERFFEIYPLKDPVFKIGESDWSKDWYFAHVLRPLTRSTQQSTQREISFNLDSQHVVPGDYTLRIAIAGAHQAALEVRVNDPDGSPLFDTGPFGKDNALARAGIHGHYYEFSVSLSHINLRPGKNSIFLCQRRTDSRFNYVMYDYLRLEAPATESSTLHSPLTRGLKKLSIEI